MKLFSFFKKIIHKEIETLNPMKKYLIVGLGNIGADYDNTRHNIGFKILDYLANDFEVSFSSDKLGDTATFRFKGRTFVLLKPSTYMNLSGKSVKYWMTKEKVSIDNVLIVADDLNIDFGAIRLKAKGSDGGHNGLKDIQEKLNTVTYPRFRFGVGANYSKGRQVDFVLSKWNKEEESVLIEKLPLAVKSILSFGTAGLKHTMNDFNGK